MPAKLKENVCLLCVLLKWLSKTQSFQMRMFLNSWNLAIAILCLYD